jgi:hypothetical protein
MPYKSHFKLLAPLAIAAAFLPARALDAKTDNDSNWPTPTADTRPWARWWWMGSAVDAANLDRELARYKAAGLGGVEITPIYGVKGWEDKFIPYLSPQWMAMLEHAIATAHRLGMKVDLTTGTGWCFGGPTVSAGDANAMALPAVQTVQPGGSLTGTFDKAATQALEAYSQDGKCVDLTSLIDSTGHVAWTADGAGPWQVYAISQQPSGQMVKRSAPGGAGPMLNPFYTGAIQRYMQWFAGPFDADKPDLQCLFQDSYEYRSDWSPDFFAKFQQLRGYPLQTELPALFGNENDDHAARVKSDYRETVSDVMTLDSMPVWVKWANAHGYLARYQAHGAPGNLLDLYAVADIPETEMFFKSRDPLVCKFASSAAHVTGRNIASAETGTWLAEHFTETLSEMKQLVDDMFLSGINHVLYHGTAYSPDDAPWPGWCFYASTEMNPRNSIWHDVPALDTYITRCQSLLQSGTSDNDVLIYWPIFDRWNNAQGMVEGMTIAGQWFETEPIGWTAHHLWDEGYAFDYISDRQLLNAKAADGNIVTGGVPYKVVVVPTCQLMPVETLAQLLKIARQGGSVIFQNKLPDDVPGWGDLANRRTAFKALLATLQLNQTGGLQQASVGKGRVLVGDVDAALALTKAAPEKSIASYPGLRFIRRREGYSFMYFIANRGSQPIDGIVTLSRPAGALKLMDPLSGKVGLASPVKSIHTGNSFHLQLDPGESIIARSAGPIAGYFPRWHYHTSTTPTPLTGTWSVKFLSGGPALPPPFQTGTLDSWTNLDGPDAQTFGGTALYSLTFDAPAGQTGPWTLSLGKVCQSANVRINGESLGTAIVAPFRVEVPALKPKDNLLEVEVTNVSANRIRDLDIRHVPWKNFYPPGLLNVNYKRFDASTWPVTDSGLFGPVTLNPEAAAN